MTESLDAMPPPEPEAPEPTGSLKKQVKVGTCDRCSGVEGAAEHTMQPGCQVGVPPEPDPDNPTLYYLSE